MAAPDFRAKTDSPDGGATDAQCSKPSGTVTDDVLLFFLYKENSAAVTWPAGFVQLAAIDAPSAAHTLYCAWKRAGGSEPSSYTASWAGNVWRDGILLCYSGVDTGVNPFDASATTRSGSEIANYTAPSITTVTNDCRIVYGVGDGYGNSKIAPAGVTTRSQNDDIVAGDKALATAGAAGTAVWTDSGGLSVGTTGITVALKPPGGGGTIYTDAGSATDIGTGSGAGVAILSDTGAASSIFRSTGAGVATFADSGAARLITVGSGPGVATSADAGSAVGALAGSGSDAATAAYLDTGSAAAGMSATGADAAITADAGSGILRSVATGSDANAYLDTGGGASRWSSTGTDAAMVSDMGSAVAALFGFGADVAVLVDSGSGVLIAIGAGADIGPIELPYQGDAYRYDSSSATGSIAGGTVLAGPSQGSATGSTGGSTVLTGPNQSSPTGPISGGTVLPPESIV